MTMKSISGIAVLALVCTASWIHSEESGTYVSSKKCSMCHAAIHKTWQTTRHAKAIESLKKTNQENLPECFKCHVTGYEKDGGFIDNELTPEMTGVQCEVCHGPGSNHIKAPTKETITRVPGETLCRQCHTQGQDPGFKYAEKVKNVHGIQQ